MYHIRDSEFIRGNIPMTKEEVRAIVIAKLDIKKESICLDIGAGTGSVSIEMARFACGGKVYAVEEKAEGVGLIKQNCSKFGIENINVIEGKAPESIPKLEYDRIFVGGSGGELKGIIAFCAENMADGGRIVLNFIVLENLMEAVGLLNDYGFSEVEVIQVAVTRTRVVSGLNMMNAENPVFVVSAVKGSKID